MRRAAQLQATIELLDEIFETRYPADRIMSRYFKQRRYIGSKDKAAISENLYTILRNRLSYEFLLERADLGKHSRVLVALLAKLEGEDIYELFDGSRYSPRRLRQPQLDKFSDMDCALDAAPQNIKLNVPEWIADKLASALGERYETEMLASNERASTDIRVNTLNCTVQQLKQVLDNVGYTSHKTRLSPWAIRFDTRVALFGLDAFKQGWFEVQDEGSQLLALLTNVKAGDKVVDFCAGAGGKTLAMAAMMRNKGTVYACDVHSKRLEQLAKRTKRAGVHNVRTHLLSSENDKWVKQHRNLADLVLIDAPCTGTGTWRRSPDSRWNLTQDNLDNLVELQQSILQSAQRLVKPGGRLIYATCSLLNEENELQVEQFLNNNPDFCATKLELPEPLLEHQAEPLLEHQERLQVQANQVRTFPALTQTDGFFAAVLSKQIQPT